MSLTERKTLLVTGGSRNIGAATCLMAAKKGWRVAVNYTANEEAANSIVAAIVAAGGDAFAIRGDIGSEAEILAMFKAVDERFGRLDGLVNNAGVVDQKARVDEMSVERLERMMRINVVGTILCAREAIRRMSTRHGGKGGAIVNVSSVAAELGSAGEYVDYAASKGAVDSFTIGLAREVAEEGVRVNGVRPGTIDTEIHASGGQPDRAGRVAPAIPMKRPGKAEEIAGAILWLLSDEASYATGTIVTVSGGR
ncbi:SDR family oxidoreductase [Pseudaminobacter sp. 19-2017]|uniref:SDR family oxidoreductase n=1 Tax=Pseudaminobacter soli (ex Zhang et al. 2022) TaxID=2831468 RepID=A0A942DW07_9HYPH|nr:SDR family oxidoreductase [Pseudaminobacter soli]MBS3647938.1 SDR family oxidoreductase [Pseudaminobacter soli]